MTHDEQSAYISDDIRNFLSSEGVTLAEDTPYCDCLRIFHDHLGSDFNERCIPRRRLYAAMRMFVATSDPTKECFLAIVGASKNASRAEYVRTPELSKPCPKPLRPAKIKEVVEEVELSGHESVICNLPSRLFYDSPEWKDLRYRALEKYGNTCACCGRSPKDGTCMHVDHIKPRSLHPHLALQMSNMQILCKECNMAKSNKFTTDWRA